MRFLILTDIEGVTGVTSFPQAENSMLGRDMLRHDLQAVISGIRAAGSHEIDLYDMHTDGRNIDLNALEAEIRVVVGKPINPRQWKSLDGPFDGLFLLGLHAMAAAPGALMAHTFLREYTSIRLNGQIVGEIAIEAALAATRGVPLLFVSGDSCGCAEAAAQFPDAVTVVVKEALGDAAALCYPPARTARLLAEGARRAARLAGAVPCMPIKTPVTLSVTFSQCLYLEIMRRQHPELFISPTSLEMTGSDLLALWAQYLTYEREMIAG